VRPEAVALLRCPHCRERLSQADQALRCPNGHSFDLARQGYVNLVPAPGDTAAMVTAREAFLGAGHLDFVPLDASGVVVDAGSGPGHYLAALQPDVGLALDSSTPALRRAARVATAVGCDLWKELPVRFGVVDTVLSVFSPRNAAEFARILRPGGRLITVTPTPDHLAELIDHLGLLSVDPDKGDRLQAKLTGLFTEEGSERHERTLELSHADALAAARMGPSAWHLDPGELEGRVSVLPEPLAVTAAVDVTEWASGRG
jgi:23S rRNA (guanine745-N1)-methyltransferase